jgi:alpha-galactosidase
MSGNLGYELDLQSLSKEDIQEVQQQIAFYQAHRHLFQFGKFYRLQAPDTYFASGWLFMNDEEAIAIYFNGLSRPAVPTKYLKMHYLETEAVYENIVTKQRYSGAELNQAGALIPRVKEDFHTHVFHWKKII